jgi:anti-anti-sigma factor
LIGELDLASVPLVEARLRALAEAGTAITLDLSGLRYCDSQGINLFFGIARIAREHGGSLTLGDPRGIVRRVFEIVDIAASVPVVMGCASSA